MIFERLLLYLGSLWTGSKPGDSDDDGRRRPHDLRDVRPGPAIMELAREQGATWGTLSSLAAHPVDPDRLYAVTDTDSPPYCIVEIALGGGVPRVIRQIPLHVPSFGYLDCEGLSNAQGGGFWLASEGKAGNDPPNVLIEVDPAGHERRVIGLPSMIADRIGDHGFEGVAVADDGLGGARLVVAFQASIVGDPEDVARIGIIDLRTAAWTFFGYPLEVLASGKHAGLSDIAHLGGNRFAAIERDGRGGRKASKWVTVFDLGTQPGASADGEPPLVKKRLAMDLVPLFRDQGYKAEKEIEGLAIAADGRVYAITDNDNERATLLLYLGRAEDVFGK